MHQIETVAQGFMAGTSEGSIAYCAVTLVRGGGKVTLVDVGYFGRRNFIVERLAALGLAPADIGRVVLTHAHWDHALNLLDFPNADVVISRAEYDYCQQPHPLDWATPVWMQDLFRRCGDRIVTVGDGDELEPGMRLLALPGHSPGSQGLLVDSPGGIVGIVGDALTSRAATAYMAPSLIFHDEAEAYRSAQKIVDTCKGIYPGHDRPFRVENGSYFYTQETSLTFINPPRDEDGTLRASISEAPPASAPTLAASARPRAIR